MDNKVIGNIVGVPNPRSDWAQEDKTKADYIKNKPSVYTTEQVDDLLDDKVDKEEGKGLSANDFADEYKDMLDSRFVKLPSSGYAAKTNLMTSQAVYQMIKNTAEKWDTETFESLLSDFIEPLANSIPMQKIYEATTTDDEKITTISTDMADNPFKLDEICVYIETSSPMTEEQTWFSYVNGNNSTDTSYYLFSFKTKTTGKSYWFKAERMCENLWFAQSSNNLFGGSPTQYYTGNRLTSVDYITRLNIHHSGIPAGSKIIVCGRKADKL